MIAFWIACFLALAGAVLLTARPLLQSVASMRAFAFGGAVAAAATLLFVLSGGPPLQGAPFDERVSELTQRSPETLTAPERLVLLTELTGRHPDDPQGWRFLGQELAAAGRYLEAAGALRRSVAIAPNAEVFGMLAGVTVALNGGEVSPAAESAYRQVLAFDADNVDARWHIGLARFQEGDRALATGEWGDLVLSLEDDEQARDIVAAAAVEQLSSPSRGPGGAGEAPFANLGGADPSAMIAGMIDGLAARLEDEPNDLSGWLSLARARAMLEDQAGARTALASARSAFADDAAAAILIASAEERFGLSDVSEENTPPE